MNIRIPDEWLRTYLKTPATPEEIRKYLSLSGPSVERIDSVSGKPVYEIEITTNRVDCMSVYGIAREAAVILPEYGINAELIKLPDHNPIPESAQTLDFSITCDFRLCPRILALKIINVTIGKSPADIKSRLEAVGQRPLNSAVDITNYCMWEVGHPIHAFDYDKISTKQIIIREAKAGESLITLDGRRHLLHGGEIIFDDGTGTIIDLPGIMGAQNSVVSEDTKNILLFVENSDPAKIRSASMMHAIRTQAAIINEKGPDMFLAKQVIIRAAQLFTDITGAEVGSKLTDIGITEKKTPVISVPQKILDMYLDTVLKSDTVTEILRGLGCGVKVKSTVKDGIIYGVTPPTWRVNDLLIAEDVVEEVTRIWGYHRIKTRLPSTEITDTRENPILEHESSLKAHLRDWGYTELYTYSMISEFLSDTFGYNRDLLYRISNPLSADLVYMRPSLIPGLAQALTQNLSTRNSLSLFELGHTYEFRSGDLPYEKPVLSVIQTGDHFFNLKGLAQRIFEIFGIIFPDTDIPAAEPFLDRPVSLQLSEYGFVGRLDANILKSLGIRSPVSVLSLNMELLIRDFNPNKTYIPIPKYPPLIEDYSLVLNRNTKIGPILTVIKTFDNQIAAADLTDTYQNVRTVRVTYMNLNRNLTAQEILPVRNRLFNILKTTYGITVKTSL